MLAFAAPLFLLGLLFVPVVIALHFIRQARRERTVSALWLWSREEAPSRKARFSPNILLLLQLLTVIAASLGAASPRLELPGRDLALILDASAMMRSSDVKPSRFEAALLEAKKLLAGARRVVIVRAGLGATVVASGNASEARANLEKLQAGDASSDLEGAIKLAAALLPNAETHVFSSLEPPTGFTGFFHAVRGNGDNLGITAFQVRGKQLFAAIESNANSPKTVQVKLERNGKVIATESLRVSGGARAIWTPKVEVEPGEYKLSLPKNQDALELDDSAFAVQGAGRVLVSPQQDDVLRAVVSVPGVRAAVQNLPPASSAGFDAMVLVGVVPRSLPAGNYIIFAPLAPQNPIKGQTLPKLEVVSGWDATSGLLRFANLEGVRARISSVPAPEMLDGGWSVLARVGSSAFIERGDAPGVRAVYVAAHPLDSDLRSNPTFPVLIFNALEEFIGVETLKLGANLPGSNDVEVILNGSSAPGLTHALVPGVYNVSGRRYTASLNSSVQTKIVNGESKVFELGSAKPSNLSAAPIQDSSARAWFFLLALIALALEAFLRGGGRIDLNFWRSRSAS
jgi:Aerotolerance regulator N-terminal/von Willebrand factor type A domain